QVEAVRRFRNWPRFFNIRNEKTIIERVRSGDRNTLCIVGEDRSFWCEFIGKARAWEDLGILVSPFLRLRVSRVGRFVSGCILITKTINEARCRGRVAALIEVAGEERSAHSQYYPKCIIEESAAIFRRNLMQDRVRLAVALVEF